MREVSCDELWKINTFYISQPHLIAGDAAPGTVDDGTILYIDPNDPQAAEILQQAGLRLAEDGTVQQANIEGEGINLEAAPVVEPGVTSAAGIAATLAAQKPADIPIKQASNGQQQVFEDAMVSHITTVESESKLLFYDCH